MRGLLRATMSVVGYLIMALLTIMGFIGIALDIEEMHDNIPKFGLTWFELGVIIFVIACWMVVISLIIRLNRYEKTKPALSTQLLSFPQSGLRIGFSSELDTPQAGYAMIAVKNTGALLSDCIGTVQSVLLVNIREGQGQGHRLVFNPTRLVWNDNGETTINIPNDGVERMLRLAYLDQNRPDRWVLAIDDINRQEWLRGWYKIDVVISSESQEVDPLRVEMALGLGDRVSPPSGLNLWPWGQWHKATRKQEQQGL